jgi:hypothetical protein
VNQSLKHVRNYVILETIQVIHLSNFQFSFFCELESTIIYYFPSIFHIFVTMSKRTWSTENEIYKKFKWIPFKIDSVPWNGLLKRHLWRRMIDMLVLIFLFV